MGVAGLAAATLPSLAQAHSESGQVMEETTQTFAKPLSDEAKKLLTESLKGIQTSAKERLKTRLPENSEPCFDFHVSLREVRKK